MIRYYLNLFLPNVMMIAVMELSPHLPTIIITTINFSVIAFIYFSVFVN